MIKGNTILVLIAFLLFQGCELRSKTGIVISKLSQVSRLSTVEVVLTKYVYDTEELKTFWNKIFGNNSYFLSRTEAVVKFGIDLSDLEPGDIRIRGNRIEMELPPVQVTNFSYPAENFRVDMYITEIDTSRINQRLAHSIDRLYQASELEIWNRLDQLQIHETVEKKTEKLLRSLLHSMGFDEIYITFSSREPFRSTAYDEFVESISKLDEITNSDN
jgi:hypothetical protein